MVVSGVLQLFLIPNLSTDGLVADPFLLQCMKFITEHKMLLFLSEDLPTLVRMLFSVDTFASVSQMIS